MATMVTDALCEINNEDEPSQCMSDRGGRADPSTQQTDAVPYTDQFTGAHFRYEEVCARLLGLQEREDPETFSEALDELEIEDKVRTRKHGLTQNLTEPDVGSHFAQALIQDSGHKTMEVEAQYLSTGDDLPAAQEVIEIQERKPAPVVRKTQVMAKHKSQHVIVKAGRFGMTMVPSRTSVATFNNTNGEGKATYDLRNGWGSQYSTVRDPAADELRISAQFSYNSNNKPGTKGRRLQHARLPAEGTAQCPFQEIARSSKCPPGLAKTLYQHREKLVSTAHLPGMKTTESTKLFPALGKGRFSVTSALMGVTAKKSLEGRAHVTTRAIPKPKSRQFGGIGKLLSGPL